MINRMLRGRAATALQAAFGLVALFGAAAMSAPAPAQTGTDGGAVQQPSAAQQPSKERAQGPGNLVGHGGPVKAVRINAAGDRVLTGSFDYSMIHWDVSGEEPEILGRFDMHDGAVNTVQFLPDGKRALSAGDDGFVWLWDLDSGELIRKFEGHTAKIVDIALSPDGRLAATASWDRTIRFWDLEEHAPGQVLKGHDGPVNAVVFTEDGNGEPAFYSAGYDGTVRHWDLDSGQFERIVYRHGWGINCLEALPQPGRLLFGSLNGEAGIIDAPAGEVATELTPHEGPVLALAVSREHKLIATGGGEGAVNVFTLDPVGVEETHQNPYGPIWSMAFTGDADKLYYAGLDDFVTLWQIRPRQSFDMVETDFPRRFQVTEDMSLGERQFARKCSVCHTLTRDGGNRAGPTLFGVFGRKAGSLPGYTYSPALRDSDIVWNEETIGRLFDHGPQHVTPGSKMPLQQIDDEEKRDALVSYLKAATARDREKSRDGDPDGAGKSRE